MEQVGQTQAPTVWDLIREKRQASERHNNASWAYFVLQEEDSDVRKLNAAWHKMEKEAATVLAIQAQLDEL